MIGEAIKQLTCSTDFTVRHVHFKTGLVLHEGKETEIITELQKTQMTSTLESAWYDFSISSLNGSTWVKHCFGKTRAGSELPQISQFVEPQPRVVPNSAWYRAMKKNGFDYGARFRCMNDITAHPTQKIAVATILNEVPDGESPWIVHPTALDGILQLFSVAAYHGLSRKFPYTSVPTYIDELYLGQSKGPITLRVATDEIPTKGSISGNLIGVSSEQTVIDMRGVSLSRIGDGEDSSIQDPHAAVELEWKADVNLLDGTKLIRSTANTTLLHGTLDKFSLACMLETQLRLESCQTNIVHLQRYSEWLNEACKEVTSSHYTGVTDRIAVARLTSHARLELINQLYNNLKATPASAAAEAIYRILRHSEGFLRAQEDPLETLLADGVLHQMCDFCQDFDCAELLELLAHRKPNIRILQIGAGTGSFTNVVLPQLRSIYGERMYSSYTYTDISPELLTDAKKRFNNYDGVEYATLDVSKDVSAQGFRLGSYDLILACNVIHATPRLHDALTNIQRLLHPQGRLFLQELDPATKWMNFVIGVLPGRWLGCSDGRLKEPYVNAQRWRSELDSAGFGDTTITYDGYLNHNILAQPVQHEPSKQITLLHNDIQAGRVEDVVNLLQDAGYSICHCGIGDIPPPGQDIISVLDLSGPYLHDANEADLEGLLDFMFNIHDAGIFWVTGAAQVKCCDPRYSMILGLARTAYVELELEFATLELQDFEHNSLQCIPSVFREFQKRVHEPDVDPTMEWAYSDGKVLISRYHWIKVKEELLDRREDTTLLKLEVEKPGLIDSMVWKQVAPVSVIGDLVEIDVRAIGLNFKVRGFHSKLYSY
jgi:SAM-dependent methyltransferase